MKSSNASVEWVAIDTGPLIALARLDLLQLPMRIFARVLITDIVAAECLVDPTYPEYATIQSSLDRGLLERRTWNRSQPDATWKLDSGEASTIEMAIRLKTAILVDDRAARRVAQALHVPTLGTCGLFLLAKRKGFVNEIKPLLDKLIESGYYLGDTLIDRVLQMAGES